MTVEATGQQGGGFIPQCPLAPWLCGAVVPSSSDLLTPRSLLQTHQLGKNICTGFHHSVALGRALSQPAGAP